MKALTTLVLFLLLEGCAAGQGNAGRTPAEEETTANGTEETTAYKEETTVQKRAGDRKWPRPPDSTLSYGGQVVRGSLGSYCWGDMCADSVFIVPPRKKALTVPSGSEMVFRYGGRRSPDKLEIHVDALGKKGTSTATGDSKLSRSLKALGSGVERTIPVELPPSEYLVDVYVEESQPFGLGQADYYFRLMVAA